MLFKNKCRAVYSCAVHSNVIAIIDHDSGRSVTNDADNVIADLVSRGFDLSRYHVIYKDTRGIWDQILVDRTGCFCGLQLDQRTRPAGGNRQVNPALTRPPGPPVPRAAPIRLGKRRKVMIIRIRIVYDDRLWIDTPPHRQYRRR
jgi:hypothetical protein